MLVGASLACRASPAAAQTSAAISIFSDDRYRGYSLSEGRPVGIVDVSYDAPDGLYGALSGTVAAARGRGLRPLGLVLNAGYAKRQPSGTSLDVGVIHSIYSSYFGRDASSSYTEVYAGIVGKSVSARIFASPDYLKRGAATVYGEVDGNLPIADKLRLSGHVGMLVPLRRNSSSERYGAEVDWRLGIVRQFGRVSAQAAWTGVRPGRDLDPTRDRSRSAFVAGLTYAF